MFNILNKEVNISECKFSLIDIFCGVQRQNFKLRGVARRAKDRKIDKDSCSGAERINFCIIPTFDTPRQDSDTIRDKIMAEISPALKQGKYSNTVNQIKHSSSVQRWAKKRACFTKQQPGRARQEIHAT